ncbi:hypothetical protein [Chryseobacterium gambrini]|uniref:ORC-CDC6 family AAA ATPase n=1 Tax=Chryseobacterium gambrini TaxID=373672 RepID=UPI003D0AB1E4
MNEINTTFLKLSKRAETVSNEYLVKTFVNVGPLLTILLNKDHEILYGRRGTGKTHALNFLKDIVFKNGDIPIYIDLRTIGSNGGIFSDSNLSLKERATRLLIDTISLIINEIVDFVIVDPSDRFDLSKISPITDKVWNSITQIKIDSEIEKTESLEEKINNSSTKERAFKISPETVEFSAGRKKELSTEDAKATTTKTIGKEEHRVHFSSVFSNLQELTKALKIDIWIIFDEWAEIPQDLQPYLSEMLRRTMLPNNAFVIKIGAIEQRTKMSILDSISNRIGIEIGADIAATQNLDEYMVFDNDEEKSINFF